MNIVDIIIIHIIISFIFGRPTAYNILCKLYAHESLNWRFFFFFLIFLYLLLVIFFTYARKTRLRARWWHGSHVYVYLLIIYVCGIVVGMFTAVCVCVSYKYYLCSAVVCVWEEKKNSLNISVNRLFENIQLYVYFKCIRPVVRVQYAA